MTLVKASPHRLALLMVGAMAASVVGCGSGDGSDDDATRIEKAAPLDEVDLTLTSIGKFDQPISIVSRTGDTALYVAGFKGTVTKVAVEGEGAGRKYTAGDTLLNIDDQVITEGERGFLDIEFSPDGKRLYVSYSAEPDGTSTIVSYPYDGTKLDTSKPKVVLTVGDFAPNHNGGDLEFGPDGFLYIAMGDGGGGGDPNGNGQNKESLLGKILRIDPEGAEGDQRYAVPADNPFADGGGKPEVWIYGLRNPWRFSFDGKDLWIGDVGQDQWEEVDLLPGGGKGANLGWNKMEGAHGYNGGENPQGAVLPVYEYRLHDRGTCAVTGGVVYRGPVTDLEGAYVFGDACQGQVRAIRVADGKVTEDRTFDDLEAEQLVSFGTDNGGDVYVVALGGGEVFRLDDPTPSGPTPSSTTAPPSSTTQPPAPDPTSTTTTTAPPAATTTTTAPPSDPSGDPGGLRAEYFDNADLTGKSQAKVEPRVYLDYEHAPLEGFGADPFSVRWTGELRIDAAGEYRLITSSDDGARLWVDDQLVIDAWTPAHTVRDDEKKLNLKAGRHKIKVEYYDNTGPAFLKLSWAGPGIPREVIPGPNLHPAAG
jgi:glucose/arabinose dehydrogenase